MVVDLPRDGVGKRVRAARRLAPGWTQETLAHHMHVSTSLVRAVEQGRVPASPSFVNAAAAALGLTPADLYGQNEPRYGDERRDIAGLEKAIEVGFDLADGIVTTTFDELVARTDRIAVAKRHAKYAECATHLPDLLADLHIHAATTTAGTLNHDQAHAELARAYNLAMHVLYRLGSPVTMLAAERAIVTAAASSDPYLHAYQQVERALPLLHRGLLAPASRVLQQVLHIVEDAKPSPQSDTIKGFTHLRLAIVDARGGNPAASDAHLDEAQIYADRLPDPADWYGGAFCTTNVTIHRVGAAVDSGRPDEAIQRNRPLTPGILPSRQAHHWVDVARAHLLKGDDGSALASLRNARLIGSELVRYHPQVRESVIVLTQNARTRDDTVVGFARWAGVKI